MTKRRPKKYWIWLVAVLVAVIPLYLFYNLGFQWDYALEMRSLKLLAMIVVACCVAYATVSFQTITNNRILTPSLMGYEAVYLLFQTVLIFVYGSDTFKILNTLDNFMLSVLFMIGFSFLLYYLILRKGKNNIFLLLLIGLVAGILFQSLSSFMQMLIDPNDFFMIQNKMFASFNRINVDVLTYSLILLVPTFIVGFRFNKKLDVLALGRDQAISLGINYNRAVLSILVIISILTSISTALVGPITFLGLIVANLSYEVTKTYKHTTIIIVACLLAIAVVVGGQFIVEQLLNLSTPISSIINLIGGIYFMMLLLKVRKV